MTFNTKMMKFLLPIARLTLSVNWNAISPTSNDLIKVLVLII